jgi:hypothetical protein
MPRRPGVLLLIRGDLSPAVGTITQTPFDMWDHLSELVTFPGSNFSQAFGWVPRLLILGPLSQEKISRISAIGKTLMGRIKIWEQNKYMFKAVKKKKQPVQHNNKHPIPTTHYIAGEMLSRLTVGLSDRWSSVRRRVALSCPY